MKYICINNAGIELDLTQGKIYKGVINIIDPTIICIYTDNGDKWNFHIDRFKPFDREEKLKRILK